MGEKEIYLEWMLWQLFLHERAMILQRLKYTPWVCSVGTHMFGATWITQVKHSLIWPKEVVPLNRV